MLDWFLSWSGLLGLLTALCLPFVLIRYGAKGATWSMLAIVALSTANFWHFWTMGIPEEEVAASFMQGGGLAFSVFLPMLGVFIIAVTSLVRELMHKLANGK